MDRNVVVNDGSLLTGGYNLDTVDVDELRILHVLGCCRFLSARFCLYHVQIPERKL